MTQIKGTFEGCREAPAPLKLNEVFISHADSILSTARSRAVTVNVSLRSSRSLFCLTSGPRRPPPQKKNKDFSSILTPVFHSYAFLLSFHHLSSITTAP